VADRVVIAVVRPNMLGTYGDGGNAIVLARQLEWCGHTADIVRVDRGGVPAFADFVLLGGGEDDAQAAVAADTVVIRSVRRAGASGAVVFGVCAGYQLLGTRFETGDGKVHDGAGLIDVATDRSLPRRAVGEVIAVPHDPDVETLTGFENHGGRTRLGEGVRPLGRVLRGSGNGDGTEGAVAGHIFGTYLHGPVFARNPAFAARILRIRVGHLVPVEVPEVGHLRNERIAAAIRPRATRIKALRRAWTRDRPQRRAPLLRADIGSDIARVFGRGT
jgi:hypothetical protein